MRSNTLLQSFLKCYQISPIFNSKTDQTSFRDRRTGTNLGTCSLLAAINHFSLNLFALSTSIHIVAGDLWCRCTVSFGLTAPIAAWSNPDGFSVYHPSRIICTVFMYMHVRAPRGDWKMLLLLHGTADSCRQSVAEEHEEMFQTKGFIISVSDAFRLDEHVTHCRNLVHETDSIEP